MSISDLDMNERLGDFRKRIATPATWYINDEVKLSYTVDPGNLCYYFDPGNMEPAYIPPLFGEDFTMKQALATLHQTAIVQMIDSIETLELELNHKRFILKNLTNCVRE